MRPIRDRSSTITWQECCPTSKPKSSGAPIRPKDSSYCPGAGSLNAPSPGSTAVEDLPRTGRTSIARASHSCALPQSASCCENSVIPLDVLGQTLRGGDARPFCAVVEPGEDTRTLSTSSKCHLRVRRFIEPSHRVCRRIPQFPPWGAQRPVGVKLRRTQSEHMFSALPPELGHCSSQSACLKRAN